MVAELEKLLWPLEKPLTQGMASDSVMDVMKDTEAYRAQQWLQDFGVSARVVDARTLQVKGQTVEVRAAKARQDGAAFLRWDFRRLRPADAYLLRLYGLSRKAALSLIVPKAELERSGGVIVTLRSLGKRWARFIDAVEVLR
jgi:hypothetical protein